MNRKTAIPDEDPEELEEWRDALLSVEHYSGPQRVRQIMDMLANLAEQPSIGWRPRLGTPYVNSLPPQKQSPYPGNLKLEERLVSIMRWNALAMVVKANSAYGELGGHISSYASAADLFEVGFNHFFRAQSSEHGGDLVFFQPHSAPGVYARAFLEGRLNEVDLAHFRQEIVAKRKGATGLSSYPHPWLMPEFWQFPTGSMGVGPINSIYQARFMRYLEHRGLLNTRDRAVWGVFGDGEMDEPESMAALTLAAREKLDNLTWVINCNLQRLDGPVRGNNRIIDELECLFLGAGWNVIKLVWGSDWDGLFARDVDGELVRALSSTVDGQLQTLAAKDGQYNREHFFGQNASLSMLIEGMSDDQIDQLKRGGHDLVKIHAAYAAADAHRGSPTVILAQTKKGFGMGNAGQGKMTTHQQKKLDRDALLAFRDRFEIPISDEAAERLEFYRPDQDSEIVEYLLDRRRDLGGFIPTRKKHSAPLSVPTIDEYAKFATEADGKSMSTTMAFVRLMTGLCRQAEFGERVVPIVADEARTFGMASLFRSLGIYSRAGQRYEPEDIGSLLTYREARDGQILEEGICEAGAMSSWVAAATSYLAHAFAMIPFYVFYSIFGFQRVGDLIWAAADQRARGFLIGATSGRTTLGGEGLQHQDGHSHTFAAGIPNCRAYDPAFAGELAVIVDHGMRQMLQDQEDVFYYVTVTNENYENPSLPEASFDGVVKGMYRFGCNGRKNGPIVRLVGSGAIMREVIEAAALLASDWRIRAELYSATSFSELARGRARATERWNRLHPKANTKRSYVEELLDGDAPIVAASDYVCALPQLIASYITPRFTVLGTDGFGRSDTRSELRRFFEVNRYHIVVAALYSLACEKIVDREICAVAIDRYGLEASATAPWDR